MYYFVFVCVAFFIHSFLIRDIYMKTAFFALTAYSPIAAALPQPEISTFPQDRAALSPGCDPSSLAQGHACGGGLSPSEVAAAALCSREGCYSTSSPLALRGL